MKKNILVFVLGLIIGGLIIGFLFKVSPTLFSRAPQNQLADCGEESMVKYCSGVNRCTSLCNLCSCKVPVCAEDPICQ
jgi:hypothetical protein